MILDIEEVIIKRASCGELMFVVRAMVISIWRLCNWRGAFIVNPYILESRSSKLHDPSCHTSLSNPPC